MSDFERGKFYGKKKYNSRSERNDAKSAYNSRMFNNKTVYNPDKDGEAEGRAPRVKQPQILIKTREKVEERSVSPKQKDTVEVEIQKKETVEVQAPNVKKMLKSAKFLEDSGILYTENFQEYLDDSSEFLVVSVVGPQGVGKSTVLNLLADDKLSPALKKNLLQELDAEGNPGDVVFRQSSVEDIEACTNTTSGIDVFVTENRIILLDCQPFMSSSFEESLGTKLEGNKRSGSVAVGDFQPPQENVGELHGLQYLAFLMSVSHVLVFVQDHFLDTNNVRFLLTAEMLKPTISNNNDDEYLEQFPHLLLVHNKANIEDFSPPKFKLMQNMYRKMLGGSKMHLESSLGLGTGRIVPTLNPGLCAEGEDPINLFLIPQYSEENGFMYRGHPPFKTLLDRFRGNVTGVTKYPLSHVQLTEKTWLSYCSKVWDIVRKSSFYVEYTKLMP